MKSVLYKNLQMLDENSKEYLKHLRRYSDSLKGCVPKKGIPKKVISILAPLLRNYDLDIIGRENIPHDTSALFICNHSNSHDFFTIHEIFNDLKRSVTPLGAKDCLDFFTIQLFKAGDVTLIDRGDKYSVFEGIMLFSKKIIDGMDGIIFSEGTWNLHPIKPMLPIKKGGTQIALIADVVVIPTIFEYVEVSDLVDKEKELYQKCIVLFGKPISVKTSDNIIKKTLEIQSVLEYMRLNLWRQLNTINE